MFLLKNRVLLVYTFSVYPIGLNTSTHLNISTSPSLHIYTNKILTHHTDLIWMYWYEHINQTQTSLRLYRCEYYEVSGYYRIILIELYYKSSTIREKEYNNTNKVILESYTIREKLKFWKFIHIIRVILIEFH